MVVCPSWGKHRLKQALVTSTLLEPSLTGDRTRVLIPVIKPAIAVARGCACTLIGVTRELRQTLTEPI